MFNEAHNNSTINGNYNFVVQIIGGDSTFALPTEKRYEKNIQRRINEILVTIKTAHGEELMRLQGLYEKAINEKADLKVSYAKEIEEHKKTIEELSRFNFGHNRLKEANDALLKGDTSVADALFKEAIETAENDRISLNETIAAAYLKRGQFAYDNLIWLDAREYLLKAYSIQPENEFCVRGAARMYELMGDYTSATRLCEEAMALAIKNYGKDSIDAAHSYSNLANRCRDDKLYDRAFTLYSKSIEIIKIKLGLNHPELAKLYHNLAQLYRHQKNYDKARCYYLQAINIFKKNYGLKHLDIAKGYNNIAIVYEVQGKYLKSELYYVKAFAIGEKILGAEHPELATWCNNFAMLYERQKKYKEAEKLYLKSIDICETKLGLSHPNTKSYAFNYIDMLENLQRHNEAKALREKYGL